MFCTTRGGSTPRNPVACTTRAGIMPRNPVACTTRAGVMPKNPSRCTTLSASMPRKARLCTKFVAAPPGKSHACTTNDLKHRHGGCLARHQVVHCSAFLGEHRYRARPFSACHQPIKTPLVQRNVFLDTISQNWYGGCVFSACVCPVLFVSFRKASQQLG